jgi:hypothetical protein
MVFLTKRDNHYSNQKLHKLLNCFNFEKGLSYKVRFDDSCVYQLEGEDQEDINKLFGYSIGFDHHYDSARFGWFYKEGKVHLYSYVYDKGHRTYDFLCKIELNKVYSLSIFAFRDYWEFDVSSSGRINSIFQVRRKSRFKMGYKLWPYFGGNNTAPHDIKIEMTKI